MKLTDDEMTILATRHANNYEASRLRDRLLANGLHFCSCCKAIKSSEQFPQCPRGRGGRRNCCKVCDSGARRRRVGYEPLGYRYSIHRKWVFENAETVRDTQRRSYHKNKSLPGPRPKVVSEAESKRRNYNKRLSLGMTGREANYMSPLDPVTQSRWERIRNAQ